MLVLTTVCGVLLFGLDAASSPDDDADDDDDDDDPILPRFRAADLVPRAALTLRFLVFAVI